MADPLSPKKIGGVVKKKRRAPLTPERIVEAAIELMDRHGFETLTMRGLGAHLSVQAMSLYQYFANKDALMIAVGEALLAKLDIPAVVDDEPLTHIRLIMTRTYRLGQKHPCFARILFEGPVIGSFHGQGETDRAVMMSLGFSEHDAWQGLMALFSFVFGLLHLHGRRSAAENDVAFQFGLESLLSGLLERSGEGATLTGEARKTKPVGGQSRRVVPIAG